MVIARVAVVAFGFAVAAVLLPAQSGGAAGVLQRLLGARAAAFTFIDVPKEGALDVFTVAASGGRVTVGGSSSVAQARGAYEYLRETCHFVGAESRLPDWLPDAPPRKVVCPHLYRHYYNVCTFGYTTAFWDWPRWEREIDWMALHGINMPLAMTGQEAVWQSVFREMGVAQKDLDAFFTGPAFLPWHRMGNVDGHAGPLPQSWIDGQAALQTKILARERELGMKPVVPAFSSFVPKAFATAHPESRFVRSSGWCGFEPTWMLDARDPLFVDVGRRFIAAYTARFGTDHLWLADVYNEMTPQVAKETREADLAAMGAAVWKSISAADPAGIWVMQGWLFYNERHFWDVASVNAFLQPVPDDRMIIIDLASNEYEVWRTQPAVRNKNWIWCTLHNYGQRTPLQGNLAAYAARAQKALTDPSHGRMVGMGLTPEGIDQNPVVYELMTDVMWRDAPVDVAKWIDDYTFARYDAKTPDMSSAWRALRETIYAGHGMSAGAEYWLRPGLDRVCEPLVESQSIASAAALLLRVGALDGHALYQRDVVDVVKRVLADVSGAVLWEAVAARDRGDVDGWHRGTADFLAVLADIDRLLATVPSHRLETWLAQARSWGTTPETAALMERNARLQVTVWGGPVLHDYACKEWSGLVSGFYAPRWKSLFEALDRPNFDRAAWEKSIAAWELDWAMQTGPSAAETRPAPAARWGEACAIAREVLKRWSPRLVVPVADRGLAVGKPVIDSGGTEGSHRPELAVDGSASGAYWAASPGPQWLRIDLQAPTTIGAVQVFPYVDGTRFYRYTVEVSTDGTTWERVADRSTNTQPSTARGDRMAFPARTARFVRVNMLSNSANVGVHLHEIRVFGGG